MTINEKLMKAPFYRKECNPPSCSSAPHNSSSNIGICMSVYIFLHHISSLSLFLCLLGGITRSEYILWVEESSLIRAVKSTSSPFSYSCQLCSISFFLLKICHSFCRCTDRYLTDVKIYSQERKEHFCSDVLFLSPCAIFI